MTSRHLIIAMVSLGALGQISGCGGTSKSTRNLNHTGGSPGSGGSDSEPGADLCEPCISHEECGGENDECLPDNPVGTPICGRRCEISDDCPEGFECAHSGNSLQCIPLTATCGPDGSGGSPAVPEGPCDPDCDTMDRVAAGEFLMGCDPFVDPDCPSPEFPYHSLELSDYGIEKFEVTVARYEECVTGGDCTEPNTGGSCNWGVAGREYHPVNCVDHEQATAFCAWAGRRLPTEAEWEKAARGTSGQLYPWGDDLPSCETAAILEDGEYGCGLDTTSEVGARPAGASPYGALDMAGNVWEWVSDWYEFGYYQTSPVTDPQGAETGTYRSLRGGSYRSSDADRYVRSSHRNAADPVSRTIDTGFRCAVSGLSSEGAGGAGGAGAGACPPDCDALVDVPSSSFWMGCDHTVDPHCGGSEFPYHEVYLDAFDIDRYEVTVLRYRECVEDGACSPPPAEDNCNYVTNGREYHPVNCVTWNQASDYCAWVGRRLPTEAEWEKAARGTDGRLHPWGDALATCEYAVINDGGEDGCGENSTLPVGSRPAGVSPYGIHDLIGNALEWVADWYDYSYYWASPASNPTGPEDGDERSARGAAWFWDEARWSRASQRTGFEPLSDGNALGFRCARSVP